MNTDPIADFLTRIRNASSAGSKIVEIPGSNVKRAMTEILFDQGFILNYKFEDDDKQGIIKIALKYNQSTKVPAITKIQRASRPGLRKYSGSSTMPRVLNGLGVAIVSTSKGVILETSQTNERRWRSSLLRILKIRKDVKNWKCADNNTRRS